MNEREELERQIRELLTADIDSITLSNRLFQQGSGLFARLGQRRNNGAKVVHSELWKLAQARLHELERSDLERFRDVVKVVRSITLRGVTSFGWKQQRNNRNSHETLP